MKKITRLLRWIHQNEHWKLAWVDADDLPPDKWNKFRISGDKQITVDAITAKEAKKYLKSGDDRRRIYTLTEEGLELINIAGEQS